MQAINAKKKPKPPKQPKKNKVSDETEENKKEWVCPQGSEKNWLANPPSYGFPLCWTQYKEEEVDDGLLKPSLYRVLWATFYHEILVTAGWKLANDILTFFSPQLIKAILNYIQAVDEDGNYLEAGFQSLVFLDLWLVLRLGFWLA